MDGQKERSQERDRETVRDIPIKRERETVINKGRDRKTLDQINTISRRALKVNHYGNENYMFRPYDKNLFE